MMQQNSDRECYPYEGILAGLLHGNDICVYQGALAVARVLQAKADLMVTPLTSADLQAVVKLTQEHINLLHHKRGRSAPDLAMHCRIVDAMVSVLSEPVRPDNFVPSEQDIEYTLVALVAYRRALAVRPYSSRCAFLSAMRKIAVNTVPAAVYVAIASVLQVRDAPHAVLEVATPALAGRAYVLQSILTKGEQHD